MDGQKKESLRTAGRTAEGIEKNQRNVVYLKPKRREFQDVTSGQQYQMK